MPTVILIETNKATPAAAATNIQWSTFFGDGTVNDLRVNQLNGKQYLTGYTGDANFPVTNGLNMTAPYNTYPDAFIAQFKANNARDWVTFYGGTPPFVTDIYNCGDYGTGIDCDAQGNVYVMGWTWSDSIPTKKSSHPSAFWQPKNPYTGPAYNSKIFFLKLDSTGGQSTNSTIWCTFLGGKNYLERSSKLRMAGSNFYMVSNGGGAHAVAASPDNTPLKFKSGAYNQDTMGRCQIYKFSNDCVYDWGTNFDKAINHDGVQINSCAWDAGSGLAITGLSYSGGIPNTTAGANIPYNSASSPIALKGDAFWALFDANDNITYCSYLGGRAKDEGYDISIEKGRTYIVGGSDATATAPFFPHKFTTGDYIDSTYGGSADGFISAFSNLTGNLVWSTYYGGSGYDGISAVCNDALGGVYIHGTTGSSSIYVPSSMPSGLYSQSYSGAAETFVGRIESNTNNFDWVTYYGGTGNDFATRIASHKAKSLYITGSGTAGASTSFPLNAGIIGQSYYATIGSIYLARFDLAPLTIGVKENFSELNTLFAYPNPSKDFVTIRNDENQTYDLIEVYNMVGQRVMVDMNTNTINMQELSNGIYIVKVFGQNRINSVKIIKQ